MRIGQSFHSRRGWFLGAAIAIALAALMAFQSTGMAKSSAMKKSHMEAFSLYQKKCLACHDSVADPEKPGRTRDDWHLVVEVMHDYGFDLTPAESETIVDLLFHLRKGMEKEAG